MKPFGEDAVVKIFVVVPRNVWVNLSHTQFPHECEPRSYSPIEEVLAEPSTAEESEIILEIGCHLHEPELDVVKITLAIE